MKAAKKESKKIHKLARSKEKNFFKDKVFLCSCDYPVSHSVEQDDLKLRALPASTRTKGMHHSTQLQGNFKALQSLWLYTPSISASGRER